MNERLVHLRVNGVPRVAAIAVGTTLTELLRDHLRLTGTKKGCDEGSCGTCTVLVDGEPVLSCLSLAVRLDGADVRTVEGLAGPEGLSRLQRAFVDRNAAQCGFCTPGMLMSATHLLEAREGQAPPTPEEVAEALAGNLCRCTGYVRILDAVLDASGEARTPQEAAP